MADDEASSYVVGKVNVEKVVDAFGGKDATPSTDKEVQVRR